MHRASFTLDPAFSVGTVDPRLFGSFVEHLGRCVYTGVHEPGHPAADEHGFRRDVLDLVRELGVTVVRYPGGNFVSGHRWEDGVGPVRKARLEPAWRSVESNEFGLGEFAAWARAAGIEPMMAVNLGTRGVQEACDLLEYANHPGGTHLSDLRAEHGAAEPYGIRLWCLGNEMDGSWQIGHRPAADYGKLAAATARAMRMIDPGLELVACGSSHHGMPTFGAWEEEVLSAAYDDVDHVSLHAYYREEDDDPAGFLASGSAMEAFIEDVVATCDHVRAKLKRRKRITLSFDEWNVWYMRPMEEEARPWERAPRLLENTYSLTDAVAVGGMLIALLRHADRVKIACQAQLVNVIAPIMTEPGGPAWRQTIFHPFAQASRYGRGEVLRVEPVSPVVETAAHGETPLLHATAVRDGEGTVTVFAVNRALDGPMELTADVRALSDGLRVLSHEVLADDDRHAKNTRENPDRVRPRPAADGTAVDGGRLRAVLPPLSWNVIRLGGA
ncbi:alpha-N-arabinofuranosidase [Planomonospora venezuelensis]|uniref:non-reducing end alpha-L-arabinofuranosidase n=1 Tax=Planomonospora venezuelensis TaxID=1999 RepID=A0A841D7H7_PLAVE|nr:alpha-N-arabinofuranosidase [Planomonospora venezuelensis]MBB5964863.1 alpha-N-arabinofuranosidase [Planomonospora venezuelensis]GIN04426.1 alpha-N-arabinofuranosidase [Planomonospora venezuelensis]